MPNIPTFDLAEMAKRNLFAVYVDVSDGTGAPEWEVQGYGTEEANLEFSPDEESMTDVLGIQHNYINKLERSMEFAPNTLRSVGDHGKLNTILHEYIRRGEITKLSTFRVLLAYWYTTNKEADMYPKCTIIPQSLGGSSRVEFPYSIRMGGEPTFGTVAKNAGVVTFTPEA